MASLIRHLDRNKQRELLDDLNYLNLQEIRCFCKEHSIPYTIHVETPSGESRRTPDTDRKSVVLGRIRHYLKTGKVPNATVFAAAIVRQHASVSIMASHLGLPAA
jgi:hypothetical protein